MPHCRRSSYSSLFAIWLIFTILVIDNNQMLVPAESTLVLGEEKLLPHQDSTKLHSPGSPTPNANTQGTKAGKGFWLTTEVVSVVFLKGCLSTALCHEPKFKLINKMTLNGEESVMSWPATDGDSSVKESARPFTTHWLEGDPEDVAMACQVAGTDPSFGFQRICDETPSRRVFNDASVRHTLMGKLTKRDSAGSEESHRHSFITAANNNQDKTLVELRGKCFNTTLAVTKHLVRCPWCPDLHAVVDGGVDSINSPLLASASPYQPLFVYNCIILALSGLVVVALAGLTCTILVHYRQKRRQGASKCNSKRKGLMAALGPASAAADGYGYYGGQFPSNGKPSVGPKCLLKYAPLSSNAEQQQQQSHRICPRNVPAPPAAPTLPFCHKRPPPPFSPPTVHRRSNQQQPPIGHSRDGISRSDLVLTLEAEARMLHDDCPLTGEQRYEEPWETTVNYRPIPRWITSSPAEKPPPPPPAFPALPHLGVGIGAESHYHQCHMVHPPPLHMSAGATHCQRDTISSTRTGHYDTSGTSSRAYSTSATSCPNNNTSFSPPSNGGVLVGGKQHDDSGLDSV